MNRRNPLPIGCVLAGGRSSRMGRDKAMLLYGDRPLLAHMVFKLQVADCDPVIAGSRPDLAAYAPIVEDLHPGCGPLAGIEAALHSAVHLPGASPGDQVLFVPVDLPLLPSAFLTLLLARAACTGAAATIPLVGGRPQPLCAVYSTALLPGITTALEAGNYKVMHAIESLAAGTGLDLFSVEAVVSASCGHDPSPAHRWFANINTPQDLQNLTRQSS